MTITLMFLLLVLLLMTMMTLLLLPYLFAGAEYCDDDEGNLIEIDNDDIIDDYYDNDTN